MKKSTKIWLWIALAISICTTALNAFEGRILSVVIAIAALAGLLLLLLKEKKLGYYIMCGCYVLAFIVGAVQSIQAGTGVLLSIVAALIGSSLIPLVTFLFLRSQWKNLQ